MAQRLFSVIVCRRSHKSDSPVSAPIVLQFARGDRSLIHETQNQVSCDAFDLALLLDEPACLWIPDSARTIGMNIGRDNTV
jgi:hypothetical protein